VQRTGSLVLAAITLLLLAASPTPAQVVVSDFASDPLQPRGNQPMFLLRGPGAAQFVYDGLTPSRFPGDPRGSLAVTYDSVEPTTRLYAMLPGGYTEQDDFVFGAVLTVRPDGFAPDPFGFHPIAFGLFNTATTGDDRTGDLSDFRADTFDTLEFAWFPNVSPLFGGPYLSPDVFGASVSQDAFDRFAFATVPLALQTGVTYLVEMRHVADNRALTCRIWEVSAGGSTTPVPGAIATVDLSGIGGFLVNGLGVMSYQDGFNVFSQSGRSLLATVDYDLLYAAPLYEGRLPGSVSAALGRLGRATRSADRQLTGR